MPRPNLFPLFGEGSGHETAASDERARPGNEAKDRLGPRLS